MAEEIIRLLYRLNPSKFEDFIITNVLPKLGFSKIIKTGDPNDKGCDAIAIKDEVYSHYRYCIQIKRDIVRQQGLELMI